MACQVAIRRDWGLVKGLFDWLHDNMSTPKDIRFVWPSILTIMNASDSYTVNSLAERLAPMPKRPPSVVLPLGVRQACRETSATLAMVSMLPRLEDEPEPREQIYINTKLSVGANQYFQYPDLGAVKYADL